MNKPKFTLRHLGINTADEQAALQQANVFAALFDYPIEERPKSYFAGDEFEIMKFKGAGDMGHIALGVDSIEDAVAYLTEKGIEFDYTTARRNEQDQLVFLYLKMDFSGFKTHLIRN